MQLHHDALRVALVLGAIWGVWHIPIYFIGEGTRGEAGSILPELAVFLVTLPLVSVTYTWLYNSTAGSLLVVCVFHSAYSGSLLMFDGEIELLLARLTGYVVVAGVIVLAAGPVNLSRYEPVTPDRPDAGTGSARTAVSSRIGVPGADQLRSTTSEQ